MVSWLKNVRMVFDHPHTIFFAERLTHGGGEHFLPHQLIKQERAMYKKVLLAAITTSVFLTGQIDIAQAAGPGYYYPPDGRPAPGRHAPPPNVYYAPHHRPGPHRPPPPNTYYAPHHRPGPYAPPPGYHRYRSSNAWRNSHGYFRPGYAIPPYYRRGYQRHVLNDWRRYNLYAPPRGHHWLLVDGNFVLAAIGTGIIAQVLLGGP